MKQSAQRKSAIATAGPTLPEGPRPFTLRFAELSNRIHEGVLPTEFCDEVTTYPTDNWRDMVTITD